jgi:hypothetical protein
MRPLRAAAEARLEQDSFQENRRKRVRRGRDLAKATRSGQSHIPAFQDGRASMGFPTIIRTTVLVVSICFLPAGAGEAQQASISPDAGTRQATAHSKASASKAAKTGDHKTRAAAPDERPCPRATWKDDPVCFDAPDEHTLPTPSSRGGAAANNGADLKLRPAGDDNVAVGLKWGASNNPAQHGYDSIPMVNSVKRTQGADDNWGGRGPDTHIGAGFDLKF